MTLAGGFPAVLVFAFLFSSITSLISAQAILKPIWKTDPTKQTNQTITDIPFRNPFTPEEILTTMSSHKFDFPFWDPIHDNITITRIVNLIRDDLIATAIDICHEYTNGELGTIDNTAYLRCLTPTLLTMRVTKVHAISFLCRQYELYPFDEEIYGILAGLEGIGSSQDHIGLIYNATNMMGEEHPISHDQPICDDNETPTHNPKDPMSFEPVTVCVLGAPMPHVILPPLLSRHVDRIVVYSSLFHGDGTPTIPIDDCDEICRIRNNINKDYSKPDYIWKQSTIYTITDIIDKTVEYRSMKEEYVHNDSPQCSAIIFTADYEPDIQILETIVKEDRFESMLRYLTDDYNSNLETIRLIFLQRLNPINSYSEYLQSDSNTIWNLLLNKQQIEMYLTMTCPSSTIIVRQPGLDLCWKEFCSSSDDFPNQHSFVIDTIYSDGERDVAFFNYDNKISIINIGHYSILITTNKTFDSNPSANQQYSFRQPSDVTTTKKRVVLILTWSIHIFIENAFGMASTIVDIVNNDTSILLDNYIIDVIVIAEMNWNIYNKLKQYYNLIIHIAVSVVDETTIFAPNMIIYNSEQTSYHKVFGRDGMKRFKSLFYRHSAMLWSYDNVTSNFFPTHSFPDYYDISYPTKTSTLTSSLHYERIMTVPYVYSLTRKDIISKLFTKQQYVGNRDSGVITYASAPIDRVMTNSTIHQHIPWRIHRHIPLLTYYKDVNSMPSFMHPEYEIATQQDHQIVIFLGSCTDRRYDVLVLLEGLFMDAQTTGHVSPMIRFYSLCERVFYYHHDYYIMKASIIINIASSNTSILETHRINYLLSLGKMIITETGADLDIALKYAQGVVMVRRDMTYNYDNIVDEEEKLHRDGIHALTCAQAIFVASVVNYLWKPNDLIAQCQRGYSFYKDIILPENKRDLLKAIYQTLSYFNQRFHHQ